MARKATANQKESADLTMAHMILGHAGERAENSDLYRWAQLVVKRHEAGESIAKADEWLAAIMAGMDVEYLDGETTPGTVARRTRPRQKKGK